MAFMISTIKKAYKSILFKLASQNHVFYRLYLKSYRPTKGLSGFLDRLSRKLSNVTVIQVGANDGITHDPIHKFIKRDGWKGVLLEPQPFVFQEFTKNIYMHDEGVHVINAAIGPEQGKASLYKISFSEERWASGLARFDRDSLKQLIDEGRLDRRIRRNKAIPPPDKSDWIEEQKVDVVTFKYLTDHYHLPQVDLLVVDTEGFDAEVLKLFDFEQYRPKAVVFEDMHLDKPTYTTCIERLTRFGYRTHRDGPNTIAWLPELDDIVMWNS